MELESMIEIEPARYEGAVLPLDHSSMEPLLGYYDSYPDYIFEDCVF